MDKTEKLRKLLADTEADQSLPKEKHVLIQLMKSLIRGNELIYRSDEYFKNGYNLGYFLIEAQRIERSLVDLIKTAEALRAKSTGETESPIRTNIPLGALVDLFKTYVEGEVIFGPLTEFNVYRRKIIHRLGEDFSKSLTEIEESIGIDYPPEKVFELQKILLEVGVRLNFALTEYMDDTPEAKAVIEKLGGNIREEISLPDLEFKILANN